MREQIINISSIRVFLAILMSLSLGACLPSDEQNINTELFKDKEEMKVRSAELKPGMDKQKAFEELGVSPDKFERMSVHDVQMSIYGNSQVQGTPEELEKFKNKLLAYEGYALPYREIKSSSSLGFGKMKIKKTGHDLKLVLIFYKGKLMRSSVEGTQEVSQQNDQYMWDMLIRRGISAAF